MDTQSKNALAEPRGLKSCLSYAYNNTKDHAWGITKKLWYLFLIAIIVEAVFSMNLIDTITHMAITQQPLSRNPLTTVLPLLTFIMYSIVTIALLCRINKLGWSRNISRYLKLCVIFLLFSAICFGVPILYALLSIPENGTTILNLLIKLSIGIGIGTLVFMIFALPITYIAGKCFSEINFKFKRDFTHYYKQGLRHIGFIFIAQLTTMIVASLAIAVFGLPFITIMCIKTLSSFGEIAMGDPSGLTSTFSIYMFLVFALANLIYIYILLFAINMMFAISKSISKRIAERVRHDNKSDIA